MNDMNGTEARIFPKYTVISVISIYILIMIIAVPLNSLVLFGNLTKRRSRIKPSSILMANLATMSLLMNTVTTSLEIYQVARPKHVARNEMLCSIIGTSFSSLYFAVTQTLMFMSIDRYYAVKSVLQYPLTVTRNRTKAAVAFIWLETFLLAALIMSPYSVNVEYTFNYGMCTVHFDHRIGINVCLVIMCGLIPFGIIVMSNWKMAILLRRHARRIKTRSNHQPTDNGKKNNAEGMITRVPF